MVAREDLHHAAEEAVILTADVVLDAQAVPVVVKKGTLCHIKTDNTFYEVEGAILLSSRNKYNKITKHQTLAFKGHDQESECFFILFYFDMTSLDQEGSSSRDQENGGSHHDTGGRSTIGSTLGCDLGIGRSTRGAVVGVALLRH